MTAPEAPRDCPLCPRLVAYRETNARAEPSWFNGAAPSFGDPDAELLVVGLAPGRVGANRTGRPFTGDYAGELLYGTLKKFGFAKGEYRADPKDGFTLVGAMVTNAVRCAPPGNKPTNEEEITCRPFLLARLQALPKLKVIVTLGDVSRRNVLTALGAKGAAMAPISTPWARRCRRGPSAATSSNTSTPTMAASAWWSANSSPARRASAI